MPPLPDSAALVRYIAEAEKALGLPLDPAWRPAVAEHYRRLLEAHELLEPCVTRHQDHLARVTCGHDPIPSQVAQGGCRWR